MNEELDFEQVAKIKVIGVGGGGNNAVNRMVEEGVRGVEFFVANTDVQVLRRSPVENKIILGKDFGQDKDLFKYYFMNYEGNEEQDSDKYEKGRNILYVAITRAIKNLRVLYIDDFEEIKDGIEKVFEKAYAFTNEISIDDF